MNEHYPFEVPPLPYRANALEPYIDAKTMEIHHDRHLKAYVDSLNQALSKYPSYQSWSLNRLIGNYQQLPMEIRLPVKNNAGGVYNHIFYFDGMSNPSNPLSGALKEIIDKTYGSAEGLQKEMTSRALSVFGSGYAWLVLNRFGRLQVVTTPNQDTPLPQGLCPILAIDVWEHAYYLKHYNKRADYLADWFHVVNWNEAATQYKNCRTRFRLS